MKTFADKRYICIKVVLAFLLAGAGQIIYGQDPQFTQFYATPLYISPSYAGTVKISRAIINNRVQWASLPRAYITYAAAVDHNFRKRNFGLGLLIMRDVSGTGRLSNTNIGLLYSYRLQIGNVVTFRPGLGFYYSIIGNDFSRHTFGDQVIINGQNNASSSVEITRDYRRGYPDATVSLLVHGYNFWGGATVDHLLRQDKSLFQWDDYVDLKYTFYGGVKIPLKTNYLLNKGQTISPSFLYKRQAKFQQLDMSLIWSNSPYMVGFTYRGIPFLRQKIDYYRSIDAVCLHLGYTFKEVTVAYSYDLTISKLATSTGGTHEISLIYDFSELASPARRKAIPCPRVY
ncbi:MAG: PorP/SprF family type IX secretion system membrane protein [Bacteroidales bacterium]